MKKEVIFSWFKWTFKALEMFVKMFSKPNKDVEKDDTMEILYEEINDHEISLRHIKLYFKTHRSIKNFPKKIMESSFSSSDRP